MLVSAGLKVEHVRADAHVLTPTTHYPVGSIIRAPLPRLVRHGIVTEAEVDVNTLDDRLIEERRRTGATCIWELVFCARARKQESTNRGQVNSQPWYRLGASCRSGTRFSSQFSEIR
jgi:hypothetical protein